MAAKLAEQRPETRSGSPRLKTIHTQKKNPRAPPPCLLAGFFVMIGAIPMSFQFCPCPRANAALDAIEGCRGHIAQAGSFASRARYRQSTVATDGGNLLVEIAIASDLARDRQQQASRPIKGTWNPEPARAAAQAAATNAGHFRIKNSAAPPRTFRHDNHQQAVAGQWSSNNPKPLAQNQSVTASPLHPTAGGHKPWSSSSTAPKVRQATTGAGPHAGVCG